MSKHNETGARGERIAEDYFINKGYAILHRNWRAAHKEVDLIALKDNVLVFIETKTRSGLGYGYPEEAVSLSKQAHLRAAAETFLAAHPQYIQVRFDVISIILQGADVQELLHLEDAF